MVSLQKHGLTCSPAIDEEVERRAGMWASINIVTEIDLDRTMDRAVRQVGVNYGKNLLEQVVAPVDVTYRIKPNAVG
jgi:hypothetical protein